MRRLGAIAIVAILSTTVACRRAAPKREEARDVALPHPELRAILDVSNMPDFAMHAPPGTRWFTPSNAEVAAFEAKLPALLREKARKPWPRNKTPLVDRAPTYVRQYVGKIEPDGKRWIWGNFLCQTFGQGADKDYWRKYPLWVNDGGDCFFNVEFSPKTGEFRNLKINGDA